MSASNQPPLLVSIIVVWFLMYVFAANVCFIIAGDVVTVFLPFVPRILLKLVLIFSLMSLSASNKFVTKQMSRPMQLCTSIFGSNPVQDSSIMSSCIRFGIEEAIFVF